jgi:hypothetical protein
MSINSQTSFWGSQSPLGGLTGASLLILASARLSWAIAVTGALFWVYILTAFSFTFLSKTAKKAFPTQGMKALYICFASFWGSIYLFVFWLLSPFAALEVFLLLMLVPLFCAESGVIEKFSFPASNSNIDIMECISEAASQAATLAFLMVVFSIVREPLSYCSLSFPGSYQGMITIMYFTENNFVPIRLFSSSAGALMLLGYIICLYQRHKSMILPGDGR